MRTTPNIISGVVLSDGTSPNATGYTSRKNATGNYIVTPRPGFRLQGAAATGGAVANALVRVTTSGGNVNLFGSNSNTGTATDMDVAFVAVGAP